jgi:hypothetical protein
VHARIAGAGGEEGKEGYQSRGTHGGMYVYDMYREMCRSGDEWDGMGKMGFRAVRLRDVYEREKEGRETRVVI